MTRETLVRKPHLRQTAPLFCKESAVNVPSFLAPFFTARFLKFCTVGFSGVFVNLGFLWIFHEACGLNQNLASALAIELSILSNFVINELWTFRDQRQNSFWPRLFKFQAVSLLGAALQWLIYNALNLLWFRWLFEGDLGLYFGGSLSLMKDPPQVGHWIYVSQLFGIAVATAWNFLANFYWTWRSKH